MKTLVSSLLCIVIIAVIGLGWLAGEIYFRYEMSNANNDSQVQSIDAYREMGLNLSNTLDHSTNPSIFIKNWNLHNEIELKIQELDSFSIPPELKTNFLSGVPLTLESENNISIQFFMANSNRVLSIDFPLAEQKNRLSNIRIVFTIAFYIGIAVLLLIWIYPLVRDLIKLNNSAREFGNGNLAARTASHQFTYIAKIEKEFNRMAERIETLVNDNKLLSRAVSHNLKTPLARLRMGIETIEECQDSTLREKYHKRLENDLCEMESLIDTLLQFAKLEVSSVLPETTTLDLNKFISSLIQGSNDEHTQTEFRPTSDQAKIKSDSNFLAIAVNNLLDNARQYANKKVVVRTILEKNDNGYEAISLVIEDDGVGIPENERDNVIKPFWRGENSNANRGHGMGLAIVSRIATWFNATLTIATSKELGGASMKLNFAQTNRQ